MHQQDFAAILERSHSPNVNSEAMWDARAEGFAAMKKTYGTQLTDKVLRYLKEKDILNGDSRVLDIGCGAGRYAVPFAAVAKQVAAADISANMLRLAAREAREQGLGNLETVKSDWRDLTGSYDLVFASMAPVLFSLEGLKKMSALSSRFCVAARYISMSDGVFEALEQEDFRKNPHQGREETRAIFNLLWLEGYQPEITYLERICRDPLTLEDAMARYRIHTHDPDTLSQRLQPFLNGDGMVETESRTTLALIVWNTRQPR